MKKKLKYSGICLLVLLFIIQFFHPQKNLSNDMSNDLSKKFPLPDTIRQILKTSCYDCHSNNTRYPWYINIQPLAQMMTRHIKKGKEELHFSEFGSYTHRRQISKLKGIANSINDDIMPLSSYKMMHKNATLSRSDKTIIMAWTQKTVDSIAANN